MKIIKNMEKLKRRCGFKSARDFKDALDKLEIYERNIIFDILIFKMSTKALANIKGITVREVESTVTSAIMKLKKYAKETERKEKNEDRKNIYGQYVALHSL